jgi:hypothetical protein
VTIEQLTQKKAFMENEHRQSVANTHAIEGALQVLSELIREEEGLPKETIDSHVQPTKSPHKA